MNLHYIKLTSKKISEYLKSCEKINNNFIYYALSENESIQAIQILENNLDKVNWKSLSINLNAIHILENNLDKVNWTYLCLNPNAIHLLENNLDKVNWIFLSKNVNAINILKNNLNKIDWNNLSKNPKFVSKSHKLGLKLKFFLKN